MSSFTLKQIGSAVLTFAVYSLLIKWEAAALLVVAVGFHEYSHLYAARKFGLPTKGFFLMPFIGGVALVAGRYRSLGQQAIVVLAGPIGGGLLAGVTAGVYFLTGWSFLAAAASWMAMLNLFNLLPFSFMDGGQLLGTITYSINRTLGFFCYAISTVVAIAVLMWMAPVLGCLVTLFGGGSLWNEYKNWKHFRAGQTWLCTENYLYPPSKLSPAQMSVTIGAWALTTGLLLLLASVLAHNPEANFSQLFKK